MKERYLNMFWLGLIVGLVVGANVSLILYACILAGKDSESNDGE